MTNNVPSEVEKMGKGKKILNLGCGDDTFGTVRMDFSKSKTTTHIGDIQKKLPFKNAEFDMVYMSFVFEHLTNIESTLKEAYRVLKRGGLIVITTDNAAFLGFHSGKYTKTLGTIHYGGYRFGDDFHYGLYTLEHVRNHINKAGFKLFKERYLDYAEVVQKTFFKRMVAKLYSSFFKFIGLPNIAGYGILTIGKKH